jgi:hypothetical protein
MRTRDSTPQTARGRMHPAFILFWIALAAVAYFGMDALIKPRAANVSILADGAREIVIPR